MRSADRGNTEAAGGKQAASQYGKWHFCPKIFCPWEKMQIIELGKDTGQPYLSCISFIHNRMPRHRGLKLKLNF